MKLLLAVDGTRESRAAIEAAENLKLQDGDELCVVSVNDMSLSPVVDSNSEALPCAAEIESNARDASLRYATEAAERLLTSFKGRGITVTTKLLSGSPQRRIVETAAEFGADLIVLGSHGYNRWERLMIGSVSDAVVHQAHCSVLIARAKSL